MARTPIRKADMNRTAIYACVSDKSQNTEDKTSISEQISDMEAHCERRGLTIVARYQEGGQRLVEEAPGVPAYAGGRQTRTLRHHRLLEVRPDSAGVCTPAPLSWRSWRHTGSILRPSWTIPS